MNNLYIVIRSDGRDKFEHLLIAEKALGRLLRRGEEVHHVDENGKNNSYENLVICSQEYHRLLHLRMRAIKACGNPDFRKCSNCKIYGDPNEMVLNGHGFWHRSCRIEYNRQYYQANKSKLNAKPYRGK